MFPDPSAEFSKSILQLSAKQMKSYEFLSFCCQYFVNNKGLFMMKIEITYRVRIPGPSQFAVQYQIYHSFRP